MVADLQSASTVVRHDAGRRHRDHRFRAPHDLRGTGDQALDILVVGSCLSEGLTHFLQLAGHRTDYVPFNYLSGYPDRTAADIARFDLMLVQVPLRSVFTEHAYMRLDQSDEAPWAELFQHARAYLEQMLDAALKYHATHGVTTFVCNFPVPQQNPAGRLLPRYDLRNPVYFVEQLNRVMDGLCRSRPGCFVLDVDSVSATFGRMYHQDDSVWAVGHGSYFSDYDHTQDGGRITPPTPLSELYEFRPSEFLWGVVNELEALHRTVRQVDQVKLVVFDLDDTLWRGVPAETGQLGSSEGWPIGLAETLTFLKSRGVLLALLSKNDEARIEALWDQHFLGRLRLSDFAVRRVNWRPKTENMREILAETNLLPRSVVFVDDNPVEREAVALAYPDMRVLGDEPLFLRRILLWSPETQTAVVTAESAGRTEMIQAQGERSAAAGEVSREAFLATLDIKVEGRRITDLADAAFPRAFELINKTNQFNTTGRRWSQAELKALFAAGGVLHAFDVADRFSRYGLVGTVIVQDAAILQMVMSCRVVGLDVELAMVGEVLRDLRAAGVSEVSALAAETDANKLSRDLWARAGFVQDGEAWRSPGDAP